MALRVRVTSSQTRGQVVYMAEVHDHPAQRQLWACGHEHPTEEQALACGKGELADPARRAEIEERARKIREG